MVENLEVKTVINLLIVPNKKDEVKDDIEKNVTFKNVEVVVNETNVEEVY